MCLIYQLPWPGTESFMQQQQGVLTLSFQILLSSSILINLGENTWQYVGKPGKIRQDRKLWCRNLGKLWALVIQISKKQPDYGPKYIKKCPTICIWENSDINFWPKTKMQYSAYKTLLNLKSFHISFTLPLNALERLEYY